MYVAKPPSSSDLLDTLSAAEIRRALAAPLDPRTSGRYLHWDKLRRLPPPAGLTSEQWWVKVKVAREGELRPLPLCDPNGKPFSYGVLDSMLRRLHRIDQR